MTSDSTLEQDASTPDFTHDMQEEDARPMNGTLHSKNQYFWLF